MPEGLCVEYRLGWMGLAESGDFVIRISQYYIRAALLTEQTDSGF
jgi:hypothetical protein